MLRLVLSLGVRQAGLLVYSAILAMGNSWSATHRLSNKVTENFPTLCRIFPLELKSNGFSSLGSTSIHSDVLSLTTPPALLTPFVFSYSAEGPTYT